MGRVVAFTYGISVYCLFLVTWLFAIAFVGDLSVISRTIDAGPEVSFARAATTNAILLLLWTIPHSVMARQKFKNWWTKIVPSPVERSTYVLTASLLMLLLFHQWRPIPRVVWNIESGLGYFTLWGVFWIGWLLVFYSTFLIDHFDMFGLRQVYMYLRRREYIPPNFKTPALHKYVRHPIMTSLIIAFWATPRMTIGHLMLAIGMTFYVVVGTAFEERDLIKTYGDAYEKYRRQVPMLLPLLKRR